MNLLSYVFIALGAAGFVVAASRWTTAMVYETGTEIVLFSMLVVTGVLMLRRRSFGRVLGLAWLRVASFAILLVPIAAVHWATTQGGNLTAVQVVRMYVMFALLSLNDDGMLAASLVGGLVFLAVVSVVSAKLYRRLAAREPHATERKTVNWVAGGVVVLVLLAPVRLSIWQHELPGFMQSKQHTEWTQKSYEALLPDLVRGPDVVEGGKGLVYVVTDPLSLAYVDIATGKAVHKKQVRVEEISNMGMLPPEFERKDRRFSKDGSLFWSSSRNALVDIHTGMARAPAAGVLERAPITRSLGFVDGGKRVLVFVAFPASIVAIDTRTGAKAWMVSVVPAVPPEYEAAIQLAERVSVNSAFSPDMSRFAWVDMDKLHLLDVATGAVRVIVLPVENNTRVAFSAEGGHVLTRSKPGTIFPGVLVDLATGTTVPSIVGGEELLHFSAARGILVTMSGGEFEMDLKLAHWSVANLQAPDWQADLPAMESPALSEDGERLIVLNPRMRQVQSAKLADVAAGAKPPFDPVSLVLPPGRTYGMKYFPQGRLLTVVQSPKAAIARLDASGAVVQTLTADFSEFGTR